MSRHKTDKHDSCTKPGIAPTAGCASTTTHRSFSIKSTRRRDCRSSRRCCRRRPRIRRHRCYRTTRTQTVRTRRYRDRKALNVVRVQRRCLHARMIRLRPTYTRNADRARSYNLTTPTEAEFFSRRHACLPDRPRDIFQVQARRKATV